MAQIIDDPGRSAGLGAALGSGLGQGLGKGLSDLATHKLNQLIQRQQQSKLASALHKTGNFTPEHASLISLFKDNPVVAQKMMEMLGTEAQTQQKPQQFIPQQEQQQQMQNLQQQSPYQQQNQKLPQEIEQAIKPYNPMDELVGQELSKIKQKSNPSAIKEPTKPFGKKEIPNRIPFEEPKESIKPVKRFGETPKMALDREKFEATGKRHEDVRKEKAFQYNKKYMDETESHAESARESEMRLDRLKTLNKENKLMHPLMYSALKAVGLDVPGLQNADMQEFEKEKNAFLKNAKSIFGARVTNYEMNQFLKTIPSLEQSPEGRARVIRNLKLAGKAAQLRANAMRDIIKENKRIPPLDLQQLVEERIGDKLDKIAKQFASGQKMADFKSITEADPSLYNGKTGTDFSTGKKYKSNGSEWVKVQ